MTATIELTSSETPSSFSETGKKDISWTDAKIKRAVYYALAALAMVGACTLLAAVSAGVFKATVAWTAAPLVVIACGLIYRAKITRDYQNSTELKTMRQEAENWTFVKLYNAHGSNVAHLLHLYTLDQLKEKFHRELTDPKTTFWNIICRYDLQAFLRSEIITKDHFDFLKDLEKRARAYNYHFSDYQTRSRDLLPVFNEASSEILSLVALNDEYKRFLKEI